MLLKLLLSIIPWLVAPPLYCHVNKLVFAIAVSGEVGGVNAAV